MNIRAAALLWSLLPACASAQETAGDSPWRLHADADLIGQLHGGFPSLYQTPPASGGNSFVASYERSYSAVLGAQLGYRVSDDTELWYREEAIKGIALSAAGGLAGLTNNDMERQMTNRFKFYRALAFVRSKWDLGGEAVTIDEDETQFAQSARSRRLTLTAGNVDVLGLFDGNAWAHKGGDRFLNWCFMTYCAFDYPADSRGYTWGASGELAWDAWRLRFGRFVMPRMPNQLALDFRIGRHHGDVAEAERDWDGGALRVLGFHNLMKLSTYAGPGAIAPLDENYAGPNARIDRSKTGLGVDLEQRVAPSLGLFARAMNAHSTGETMAFTEADRSLSGGLVADGEAWGRSVDSAGLGFSAQFASADRVHYLAQGLFSIFIGDGPPPGGRFRYGAERVLETWYLFGLGRGVGLTADWQHLANPAYNRDRGPIDVFGLRLHAEI